MTGPALRLRALVAALALVLVACTGQSSSSGIEDQVSGTADDPTAPNNQAETLEDISDGSGAYEIHTNSSGREPFRLLMKPAPVGTIETFLVTVDRHNGPGTGQVVSSEAKVEVIRSIASGEGTLLSYTLGKPLSGSGETSVDLAALDGLGADFWLNQNRVGVSRTVSSVPKGISKLKTGLALDLLEAPLTLAMPLPEIKLGPGATWSGQTRSADGFVIMFNGQILRNSLEGFEVRLDLEADIGSGDVLTGVLTIEGRPGTALPTLSSLSVELPDGSGTRVTMECTQGC